MFDPTVLSRASKLAGQSVLLADDNDPALILACQFTASLPLIASQFVQMVLDSASEAADNPDFLRTVLSSVRTALAPKLHEMGLAPSEILKIVNALNALEGLLADPAGRPACAPACAPAYARACAPERDEYGVPIVAPIWLVREHADRVELRAPLPTVAPRDIRLTTDGSGFFVDVVATGPIPSYYGLHFESPIEGPVHFRGSCSRYRVEPALHGRPTEELPEPTARWDRETEELVIAYPRDATPVPVQVDDDSPDLGTNNQTGAPPSVPFTNVPFASVPLASGSGGGGGAGKTPDALPEIPDLPK